MRKIVQSRLAFSACFVKGFMRYSILLLLAYALLPGAAMAKAHENLVYSYYEVKARSDQPLSAQLYAASPIKEEGQTFHGHTNWTLQWTLKLSADKSGFCRISSAKTQLHAVVILPKLDGANTQQLASFDRYVAALQQHELGHYKIAEQAAQAIEHKLHAVKGMRNCATLQAYANKNAQRTLDYFNEKNRQYDRETNHGQMQGAWLHD